MEATAKKKKPKKHTPANRLPRAKSANHIEAMDEETAGEIGRMVSTQLVVGNWEGARSVLMRQVERWVAKPEPLTLDTPITEAVRYLPEPWVDNRAVSQLAVNGYVTIGDLLRTSREQLESLENFGEVTIEALVKAARWWAGEIK
jgi:hypothetical protein